MSNWIYLVSVTVLLAGLLIVLINSNYWKKMIGLNIIQTSVLIFYLTIGKITEGVPPIYNSKATHFTSPLPQVLMLTAIVVGFATLAVGMAIISRIYKAFGTIDEQEIEG